MKMITRCPVCSTLFKVVPDQLRIAGGWVRCGQCMVAFDAQTNMLPADPQVLRDLGWREQDDAPGGVSPSGADAAAESGPQAAADPAAGTAAAAVRAVGEPWTKSPAIEIPAVAVPVFESPPPRAPDELVFPEVIEETPAADSMPAAAAESALPAPKPTDEELDRRHAQLIETLARLHEKAERRKRRLAVAEAGWYDDDPDHLNQADTQESRYRPERDADHDAATQSERGRRHGREDRLRSRESEQEEQDGEPSRPMIDFVLSEIGRIPPESEPPRSPRNQPRREPESRPAPLKKNAPSFIKQAQRRAFWALPQVRAGLWIAAGALAVLLAAQVVVNQRDRLAAQYPGTAPLLRALCRPMVCRIAPWRKLDAVAIDSSSFVRTGLESFNFTVTLRNSNAAPVAMPALELALTDTQDQLLARRVLNPADWGAPPQLAAHGQFGGSALLTVLEAAQPQAVSGYRLTAFYP